MPEDTPLPPAHQSRLRRAILPVSLALGAVALSIWGGWALFATQRQDVATARAFLTHIAAEDYAEAEALAAPALIQALAARSLANTFGQIEPWDHIGFSSRRTNGMGARRTTELYGTGHTPSGCESALDIRLINGAIAAFNVTPLCPRVGQDV